MGNLVIDTSCDSGGTSGAVTLTSGLTYDGVDLSCIGFDNGEPLNQALFDLNTEICNIKTDIQNLQSSTQSYDVLTDTPSTKTGANKNIIYVDESQGKHFYKLPTLGSNVLVVSKGGDDSTASKGSYVFHYATIEGAEGDAVSGDVILIYPGSYSIPDGTVLGKDGVTYYFFPGAIVTGNNTTDAALFSFTGAGTIRIRGGGTFVSGSTLPVLYAENGVTWYIEGTIQSANNANGIIADEGSALVLDRCKILLTNPNSPYVPVSFGSGASGYVEIYVYECFSNAKQLDVNVRHLINSIQISNDVI